MLYDISGSLNVSGSIAASASSSLRTLSPPPRSSACFAAKPSQRQVLREQREASASKSSTGIPRLCRKQKEREVRAFRCWSDRSCALLACDLNSRCATLRPRPPRRRRRAASGRDATSNRREWDSWRGSPQAAARCVRFCDAGCLRSRHDAGRRRRADFKPVAAADFVDAVLHVLVNHAVEANARVIAKQTKLRIGRPPHARIEAQPPRRLAFCRRELRANAARSGTSSRSSASM